MFAMRRGSGSDLRYNAFVCAEQWKVAVRRRRGDDLDHARIVEPSKAGDDIRSERGEVVESLREIGDPPSRSLCHLLISSSKEAALILSGRGDLAAKILRQLRLEDRMCKLLQQNRREIQVSLERNSICLQAAQHPQQGKIRLRSRFQQPFHAMWPSAVVHHIGQMRVQREVQVSRGSAIRHNDLLLRIGLESSLKPGLPGSAFALRGAGLENQVAARRTSGGQEVRSEIPSCSESAASVADDNRSQSITIRSTVTATSDDFAAIAPGWATSPLRSASNRR